MRPLIKQIDIFTVILTVSFNCKYFFCPCRDFAQKAKSRGGTLVACAYIKESTHSWNIQSVMESYEPNDPRYKHLESLSDRNGDNLPVLFLSLWGNKAQLSSVHKTPKKQDEWINAELITRRTTDDYRNSPTINFCVDLFPAQNISFYKVKKKTRTRERRLIKPLNF